jgi:hypothetical protein
MKVIGELKVVTASPQISTCKIKSKGEVPVASLVRLKASDTRILKWMQKIPVITVIKDVVKGVTEEIKQ